MSTMTIRVRRPTYEALKTLARAHDESLSAVVDRLVEESRRSRILEEANEVYAAADSETDAS